MHSIPRSTRREFLTGTAAVDLLGGVDAAGADRAGRAPDSEGYLLRLSRRAMACTFEIFLPAGGGDHETEAALAALDLVDELEDQLSVYRPASEISRLNRAAADEAVPVEPRLFALLATALQIHRETRGAFDVTAGRLSEVWGFTRRAGTIPDEQMLQAARARVGSRHLVLAPQERTVRFERPGLEINLGSIGKGYALDRAAELLEAQGVENFLLHGGNSSVLARGNGAVGRGWLIGVRNPLDASCRLGQLRLVNRALATSGSGTQFFVHEGRRYGHILDPRSGRPAEGTLSASVLAPTAAAADALATAFYVMGPQSAAAYCQSHADVAAVLFSPAAREGRYQTHLLGLDAAEWMVPDGGSAAPR